MRFPRFVAFRLARTRHRSFSSRIIQIAVGAVAISVAVMIVTVALVRGFKFEISEKIFGFWGHINITDIRADNSYEAMPVDIDSTLLSSLRNIGKVEVEYGARGGRVARSEGGVRHVQAVAQVPAIITTREQMEGIVIKGVGEDYDFATMRKFLKRGRLPDLANDSVNQIVISEQTADRLEIDTGDQFLIHFLKNDRQIRRRFEVTGVYRTGLEEYDEKYAFAPLSLVQELLGWEPGQVAAFEIFVDHVDDAEVINDYIYLEELPSSLYSQTIRSRFPAIFEWLELQDVNQLVILLLTVLVAAINMVSVLLVLILERTRMIGLFKSLGARTGQIQRIFINHAMIIVFRGVLIGNALGIGLCLLQKRFRFITLDERDYYLSYAPVDLDLIQIAAINAMAIALIGAGLLIPSLLVARIDPIRTLQFR